MLLEKAESWVSSIRSAKLLRNLLKDWRLLPWTWLHVVLAGLLVPLVNGMGNDPSFRADWVLIAAWEPLGAGAASCSASFELSKTTSSPQPVLPCLRPPALLVLTSSCRSALSGDALALHCSPFCGSRFFPLLLAELFLIILFGLLCTIINS